MAKSLSYASFLTLEYVDCLAQERSFSRAAQALFISQSALSQHILGLEKKLRVQLFDRSCMPLRITAEGKVFVEGARAILQSRGALWRTMSDFADFRRGEIVLGTTPVRSLFMLPKILPLFAALYPDMQLTAREASSAELEAMVLNDAVDLAVFPFSRETPGLSYETLYAEKVCLYAPPDFATPDSYDLETILRSIAPKALILMHSQTKFGHHVNELLRSVSVRPRVIEVSNYITALMLVAKGMGIAFAPDNFFGSEDYWKDIVPLPVELKGGTRKIVVAFRQTKWRSRATYDLIEIMKQMVADGGRQ